METKSHGQGRNVIRLKAAAIPPEKLACNIVEGRSWGIHLSPTASLPQGRLTAIRGKKAAVGLHHQLPLLEFSAATGNP
jgi:hypothetical protein